ncbi:REDY-like protein HapK [Sphingomonas fennica]|uniref:REDY-like protein HapK n=1 Tax=Edaphosphingomonas fennica TaxID=114404 RepID=A0A2T4I716_9SPHN|nr:REDY-like protein HapK [Sphingomonas fennica]PTD26614.1 REDY-like protein HapK [Sphingomonas fennica]
MRIIVLFNLKPEADPAAYENWARTTDIPGVRALPSVSDFQVHRATGVLGSDQPSPYAYFEVIDITDMAAFGADAASEAVQKVAGEFRQFADDPQFILTEAL